MTVFDDGSGPALYVGGSFLTAGGVQANNIARWNGSTWSPLGSGIDVGTLGPPQGVMALGVFADSAGPALYAGGRFVAAGGVPAHHLARWDGVSWSAADVGLNGGSIYSFTVFDDGGGPALYAGGHFNCSVVRWNGSSWSLVGGGVLGSVWALSGFDDGVQPALYAGGQFGGNIARWNGSSWSSLGDGVWGIPPGHSGAGPFVHALAVFDDGSGGRPDLFLGGQFTEASYIPSWCIAKWRGCGEPLSEFCFGDGSLTACPCDPGFRDHGCRNSVATGGARLFASGAVHPDSVILHATGERPGALTLFLQGDSIAYYPYRFGDGLGCIGGNLLRLFVRTATHGSASVPEPGDPGIKERSRMLGDPLTPVSVRYYQTQYRDPDPGFCAAPWGGTFNATNGMIVTWQ